MFWGFVTNAAAFAALGTAYAAFPEPAAADAAPVQPQLKFALFCLSMFSLSWGPNLATYVVPVAAFPAEVRGTFHGLSAAAGKAGAALGAFLYPVVIKQFGNAVGAQTIFFIQVGVNAVGAFVAWRYLPASAPRDEEEDELYASLTQ